MRKRTHAVNVRMTDDEYEQLLEKVNQSGQTIQSYIIDASLYGKITSADEITEKRNKNKLLADIDKQLRVMGTNLNQMAHVANGYGEIPSAETLIRISNEVSLIKKEVNEEWQLTRQSISRQNRMVQCETV